MANFCILRTKKLKTNSNVGASFSHAFRERDTPNADPDRLKDNVFTHNITSTAQAMAKYKKMLPEKVRKNGVRCIEYLITASPEAMIKMSKEQQTAYFNESIKWLKARHGDKNIVFCGVHRDETTPHMFAYVIPIDSRGKLNCREFLGGREKMTAMQDSFADEVGAKFDMERGIKGSRAKHQTIKEWYAKAEKIDQALMPPKKRLTESWEDYQERYKNQVLPYLKKTVNADKKANEHQKEKTTLENQNKELNRIVKSWHEEMNPDSFRKVADLIESENANTWLRYLEIKKKKKQQEKQQEKNQQKTTRKKRDTDWER